jgi:hypothetical protein
MPEIGPSGSMSGEWRRSTGRYSGTGNRNGRLHARRPYTTAPLLDSILARWYDPDMKTAKTAPVLDRLIASLSDCLTPESARRLLALKPDPELQRRVDDMATRHTEQRLSPEEEAEYGRFVSFAAFIAILKSKARQLLAASDSK